jgi:hypothetical protein
LRVILKNGLVFHKEKFSRMEISIKDGRVEALASGIAFTGYRYRLLTVLHIPRSCGCACSSARAGFFL